MDEYIKREDAIKAIAYVGTAEKTDIIPLALLTAQKKIRNIPAADVAEVRHAKWIAPLWGPFDTPVTCSWCHTQHRIPTGFCSACGAKMDGERREGK